MTSLHVRFQTPTVQKPLEVYVDDSGQMSYAGHGEPSRNYGSQFDSSEGISSPLHPTRTAPSVSRNRRERVNNRHFGH